MTDKINRIDFYPIRNMNRFEKKEQPFGTKRVNATKIKILCVQKKGSWGKVQRTENKVQSINTRRSVVVSCPIVKKRGTPIWGA